MRRNLHPVRTGLVFAVIAGLFAFYPLAFHTFDRLLSPKGDHLVQEQVDYKLPVPKALLWNAAVRTVCSSVAELSPPAQLLLAIFLVGLGLYELLCVLNPTFRLTTGVDWDGAVLVRTYMHTVPLIKAFLIAMAAFVPAFAMWLLIEWAFGQNAVTLWLRLALLGGLCWILFSRDGVAGDYESFSYELPRDMAIRKSLLLRGAAAGTIAWVGLQFGNRVSADGLIDFYHAMGGIGQGQWWWMAAMILGPAMAAGFGAGALFAALGAPNIGGSDRLRLAAVPIVILAAAVVSGRALLPGLLRDRYDWDPASRLSPESRLARLAGLPAPDSSSQLVLVLAPAGTGQLTVPGRSVVGLSVSRDSARKIEAFLAGRGYATALSYPAYVALHDAASVAWSPAESLRVSYMNLAHSADPGHLRLFLDKLGLSAATPDVVAYADKMADDQVFAFPQRSSLVFMGDVLARLGESARAAAWYRRAEMPAAQITTRLAERNGDRVHRLSGRITRAGSPAAGLHVGFATIRALRMLPTMAQPDGSISPFWLYHLSAATTTDAQGRYVLERLGPEPGRLVLGFDPKDAATILGNRTAPLNTVLIQGAPDLIRPGAGAGFDLGTVALQEELVPRPKLRPGPAAPPASRPPSGHSPGA